MLVTDLVNVRYLTGFTGSNAAVLVHADEDDSRATLATDGRYRTQASQQAPDMRVEIDRACGSRIWRRWLPPAGWPAWASKVTS